MIEKLERCAIPESLSLPCCGNCKHWNVPEIKFANSPVRCCYMLEEFTYDETGHMAEVHTPIDGYCWLYARRTE